MSRIIVGPFNRVEGDLELTLDIADGRVEAARVTTPLYRGFEQILAGRPAADALVVAPRICGICSLSQSIAAASALRALEGLVPAPNGELATNIAHAAENIADHLTHFYLFFMPDFARREYADAPWFAAVEPRFKAVSGAAASAVLPARTRLLHIMGLIAGKWPHSLAIQPGGVTRTLDLGEKMRLIAIIAEFRSFIETTLFAAPLEAVTSIESIAALDDFVEGAGAGGDFATFMRLARALKLDELGRGSNPLMSFGAYASQAGALFSAGVYTPRTGENTSLALGLIEEDVACAYMRDSSPDPALAQTIPDADREGAYSWAKAPRLDKSPAEVGALARQAVDGNKLARALLAQKGASSVMSRVVARMIEIARLTQAAGDWARALRLQDPFCVAAAKFVEGQSAGMIEAARGSLGHWVTVKNDVIERYQIIAPTTWNFSPRDGQGVPGPLEQALVGVETGDLGARAPAIQHVVRSFDPCMVCTAH
ncbi:MAG: nickel-dependent hydrogenase large subunit [Beijerinckiaceae bacterium]|nr:nickel-dependent hydrogenase large subunit [Beijerinckiaceae bacterium]